MQKVHYMRDSSECVFRPKHIVFTLVYKLLQNYTGKYMPEKNNDSYIKYLSLKREEIMHSIKS